MALARIRTIKEAFDMIIEDDPSSSLTYSNFRRIVLSGRIPTFRNGNRYLLNFDDVEKYLSGGYLETVLEPKPTLAHEGIRKIVA